MDKSDTSIAKALLTLLRKAPNKQERLLLIDSLDTWHWNPDANKDLMNIANDINESLELRTKPIQSLIHHSDINSHIPLALEIIQSHEKGLARQQSFNFTLNLGDRLFALDDKNKRGVLNFGFNILKDLPTEDMRHGYFIARRLGAILKIKSDFAPNQQNKKYRGNNGLTDDFFVDTVNNALDWYSKNWKIK